MRLTWDEWAFLVLWIINLLISIVYLLVGIFLVVPTQNQKKRKAGEEILHDGRQTYFLRTGVMVLCPVVGPLFFFLSYLLFKLLVWTHPDLEDVTFSKERVKTQLRADEERERDMIPLEEAISVNEKKDLRQVMLNTIRGDIQSSLSAIAMALNIEDTESSHYAASILSDALNTFRVNVQRMYKELETEPDSQVDVESEMLSYMDTVLCQQVFTDIEQRRMVGIMEQAAQSFYSKEPFTITPKQYEDLCLRLLEIRDYEKTSLWCQRLASQYPDELAAYTCRLKLYFTQKDREAFFQTLNSLKASGVLVDSETLELIRVFS